jgi:hypothetical protein
VVTHVRGQREDSFLHRTVVDLENTLMSKTCFVCPQNFTYNEHIRSVYLVAVSKISFVVDDCLGTDVYSSIVGIDAIDNDEILREP